MFEGKTPQDTLRIWSVGCATGEEAYSLAMLFLEEAGRREAPPQIQIFASDLHKRSLESAREGVFSGDVETDVTPERLKRFFVKENGGYRIRKEVRDLVVFAPHNLLGDPPFLRMDLVSCRNLLIYLDRSVQGDVVDLFHYALSSSGFLLLGTSETLETAELFRIEDKKLCIYQKRNVPGPEPRLPVFPLSRMSFKGQLGSKLDSSAGPIPYQALHQNLLERYSPPSMLVGPDDKLVHLSEHAGRYLVHPGGPLTSNAVKLVREELRIELQALLQQARSRREPIDSRPIGVQFNGHSVPVVMHVRPSREALQEDFVLVLFSETHAADSTELTASTASQLTPTQESERIAQLENELNMARQRLQAIIEEYETSREEMKATNEEMQSANEELRSTMEELETSKEELQSINEELQTVNQENRHKVEELSQLSSDLQNLLAATEIATLFLDRQLRILRFTPRVAELFNVRITDRGRPISDLTHRLGYEELRVDAEGVLSKLVPVEREVQDETGKWYLTRILPYRSTEDRIDGIVITFIDITAQKKAENLVRASARELFVEGTWLRTILDSLSNAIIATDKGAQVRYLNPVAAQWTGWAQSEAVGKLVTEICELSGLSEQSVEQCPVQKALADAGPTGKERFVLRSRAGKSMQVEGSAAPIVIDGAVEGAVAVLSDIRERIGAEEAELAERGRLEGEISRSANELGQSQADLRALSTYLMIAQEQERRRLARELHDDFGQRMSLLSMNLDYAIQQIRTDPKECEDLLRRIHKDLSVANDELREVSHRLHPAVIEDLGLIAALRSLVTSFRENGSEVTLRLPDQIPELSIDTATGLYRIAQEALRNAQTYAKGAPVHLTLTTQDGHLNLEIHDNGPGFSLANARRNGGLGLLSMQERARLAHGTMYLESQPGEGTVVRVCVPV